MQNSRYTVIPAQISIPNYIVIGELIGREGRNLKPIAERTGTSINVNTSTTPAQIEIKISNASSLPPSENQINEAKDQLNDLIKSLDKKRNQTKEKKKKSVKHLNDKKVSSNRYVELRRQKEISLRKERIVSNRERHS